MPSPQQSPLRTRLAVAVDARVRAFLEADSKSTANDALVVLMEVATITITRLAWGKFRTAEDPDAEETVSEARAQVAARLHRLRVEWQDGSGTTIADFEGYVAGVTFTVWTNTLRRRHPARVILLNRLRYLLENRTGQSGFALWNGPAGECCCGFAAWRGDAPAVTPRLQSLHTDPIAVATAALDGAAAAATLPLAEIVACLLSWLGGPLELRDLLEAVAEVLGVNRRHESLDADGSVAESADPGPSPHDQLRWREYLAWLWREILGLSLRQRTAYLLHSSVPHECELLGLTSVRQTATVLELPPERMAELWNDIPLDDRTIAALLGASCQQVINLRKVARLRLGRAWQQWIRH